MREGEEHEGWQKAGGHAYRCERAGILFLRTAGDLAEQDVATVFAAFERLCDAGEHVFWLIDLARLGVMLPDARKLVARTPLRRQNKGAAIFGASFHQRAIVTLVFKAMELLQRDAPPLAFFPSEAEARAWIDARRRKLEGERGR
jgi:hypothetical protein